MATHIIGCCAVESTFSKLTVAKDFELRKVIREAGGKKGEDDPQDFATDSALEESQERPK